MSPSYRNSFVAQEPDLDTVWRDKACRRIESAGTSLA
jgi:hypothetical protein